MVGSFSSLGRIDINTCWISGRPTGCIDPAQTGRLSSFRGCVDRPIIDYSSSMTPSAGEQFFGGRREAGRPCVRHQQENPARPASTGTVSVENDIAIPYK